MPQWAWQYSKHVIKSIRARALRYDVYDVDTPLSHVVHYMYIVWLLARLGSLASVLLNLSEKRHRRVTERNWR